MELKNKIFNAFSSKATLVKSLAWLTKIKEELEDEFNKAKEQAVKKGEELVGQYEKQIGKNQKLRDKLGDMKKKLMTEEKEVSYTNLASTSDSDSDV